MELQQRVIDYINSIDTSDTILMITDAAKGNYLSDLTEYLPLLVDYLLLQTRNMTIRVGGESFRLAEMFLDRGENMLEHIVNPKRFEIYTVQSNMKDSWATIIDMDNFHFDIESDFIQVAMKYFRGHMVPYYVNHNWNNDEMRIATITPSGGWEFANKGAWTIADTMQALGCEQYGIKPATCIFYQVYLVMGFGILSVIRDFKLPNFCYISGPRGMRTSVLRGFPFLLEQLDSVYYNRRLIDNRVERIQNI